MRNTMIFFPLLLLEIYFLFALANSQKAPPLWTCGGAIPDVSILKAGRAPPGAFDWTGVNRPENFVPFKILYLINKNVKAKNKAKLEKASAAVRDKLVGIVKAPRLIDIRLSRYPQVSCPQTRSCGEFEIDAAYIGPCYSIWGSYVPESGIDKMANAQVEKMNDEKYSLVIFITVHEDDPYSESNKTCQNGLVIAFAGPCRANEFTGRPTQGRMVFCHSPSELDKTDGRLTSVLLHESLHVVLPDLVGIFDPTHSCLNEILDRNVWANNCRDKTWKTFDEPWIDSKGNTLTRKGFVSILSGVASAAKKHLGCDRAKGIELNYIINATTRAIEPDFAHWNSRLFAFDILAPHDVPEQRLSIITLSAMASYESWYKVDLSKAEEIIGKPESLKCDVMGKSCHQIIEESKQDETKSIAPYCDDNNANPPRSRCSKDHRTHLLCYSGSSSDDCLVLKTFYPLNENFYDSVVCEKAKRNSLEGEKAGGAVGNNSICVTFAYFPYYDPKITTLPICVRYECRLQSSSIWLKLHPNDNAKNCTMMCTSANSNRLIKFPMPKECLNGHSDEHFKIICPDYQRVCIKSAGANDKESMLFTVLSFTLIQSFIVKLYSN